MPIAARPAGGDDKGIGGPLRPPRTPGDGFLGNEAAREQRPQRPIERRAFQPDGVGDGQEGQVRARGGGEQDGLVSESLGMIAVLLSRRRELRGLVLTEGTDGCRAALRRQRLGAKAVTLTLSVRWKSSG